MRNTKVLLSGVLAMMLTCGQTALASEEKSVAKEPAAFSVKVTGMGQPMILIPGLGCGGNVWDATVDHFKDKYQCHVLTLAGFAGEPVIGSPMLPKVRDGIIAYITEKKLDHPIIVGHSLGGFMTYWLGETAPDKVGPIIAVDGVPFFPALMNAKATVESSKPFADQMKSMYEDQTSEQFAQSFRSFLASMIKDQKNLDMVASAGTKSDPKAVGEAGYELMSTDLRPDVKNIKSPVLLIGAAPSFGDPNTKKAVMSNYEYQIATIPNHKLVFVPDARHFVMLDQPEAFYKEVDAFLKDADTKKGQ
jgi:N-formylmaleamate deformylase